MPTSRAKTAFLTLLTVCLATAGAAAYAASGDTGPSAHYAVFRHEVRPIDRLTKDGRELARHTPKSFHIHAKEARRTRLKADHGVWLIPGRNSVCLFVEQRGDGVRSSCNHLSGALTGALYVVDYRHGKAKSFRKLTGALPDNGGHVRLVGAGGRENKLPVRHNTYSVHLSRESAASFKPRRITYEVGGRPFSIPLKG